ncbi:head GIN domain-containing protein [Olleya aquimaris]|uniref:Putative autotransporter adhesin-like protein n=1 Tax=Olleya aquimaris TaxID=639310 RepID=A0A327RF35_9FLAO|nr:head GIN domain-containing protein [Olleya aquimaris]RAJ14542.1 putative autotransporter adhesin-like protein [Olleya aquimaris]
MKNIIYILTVVILLGCNSSNAPDCFQNAGDIIQQEVVVPEFTKITSFKNVELFVSQGVTQSVVVEIGEFLIDDIDIKVEDDRLLIKDNNTCNLTRDYGITKVYVTTPNLTEIRNSSTLDVHSLGILNFENLKLLSEDYSGDFYNVGNFNIQVNCTDLLVVINNLTTTTISGTVDNLRVTHASGDGRFEGRQLIAQQVTIFHRGSNDIIVNPQLSLTANLVSTGDVIAVNTPLSIDITEQFDGRVIFE